MAKDYYGEDDPDSFLHTGEVEGKSSNKKKKEEEKKKNAESDNPTYGDYNYNNYVADMARIGASAVDKDTFVSRMDGANGKDYVGRYVSKMLLPAYDEYVNKINTIRKERANLAGEDYYAYTGSWEDNFGDWRGKNAGDFLGKFETKFKPLYQQEVDNYATWKSKNVDPETGKLNDPTKFDLPEEFTSIEELAKKRLAEGEPKFGVEEVSAWQNKLEEAYAPTRQKLKQNMAEYWASLFPEGGGSGRQARNDLNDLSAFETDKLNRSIDFANTDLGTQLALYQKAQDQLMNIGSARMAGSAQNANQQLAMAQFLWDKQYADRMAQQDTQRYNQQTALAKYLAEIQKPKSTNPLDTLASSFGGGAAQVGGAYAMAQLLPLLLSSRDYKRDIRNATVDTVSLIKSLDMKEYKYKGETKKRIGVIAENTPDLLTTDDKKALDVVNLFGVLLDAVKKLTLRIEALEGVHA